VRVQQSTKFAHYFVVNTGGAVVCILIFHNLIIWFQDTLRILILEHGNIEADMAMFSVYVLALTSGLEI